MGGRPGIGGGFDSSHRPVVGTFDRFNGLSSNILLTFSCYFGNPLMLWGGAFEQKLSARFTAGIVRVRNGSQKLVLLSRCLCIHF